MIYHKITAFFGLQNRLFQDYLQQLLVLFFVAYVLCACKKELHSAVWIIFDFVNADNPMLRSVGFFQNIQFKIFVSDLGISYSVITRWFSCKSKKMNFQVKMSLILHLTSFSIHLSKSVIAHFVHQTIEQSWTSFGIHPKFARRCVVIIFLNVFSPLRISTDPYHP